MGTRRELVVPPLTPSTFANETPVAIRSSHILPLEMVPCEGFEPSTFPFQRLLGKWLGAGCAGQTGWG